MKARLFAVLVSIFAAAYAGFVTGRSSRGSCSEGAPVEHPIDPLLLAFLSRARAAHHLADLAEAHDRPAALRALTAVVEGPVPEVHGKAPPESREVLADTEARLADLHSLERHFEEAHRHVNHGLTWVPETSYFRGHLLETRGLIEQRWAEEYLRLGRDKEAAAAKARALLAFEAAMEIQAEVIRTAPPSATDLVEPVPTRNPGVPQIAPSSERGSKP